MKNTTKALLELEETVAREVAKILEKCAALEDVHRTLPLRCPTRSQTWISSPSG